MKCSLKFENKKKYCITLIISFCVFDLIFSACCSTFSKYSKDTFIVLYEHICVICIRTAPSFKYRVSSYSSCWQVLSGSNKVLV